MLKRAVEASTLYRARGVPFDVATAPEPEDMLSFLLPAVRRGEENVTTVRPSEQRRHFEQALKSPLKPAIYIIAGKRDDRLAKAAAFSLFRAAFAQLGYGRNSPYWHTLIGGFQDRLRDDESYRDMEVGTPGFLVLANLPLNATAPKFEKARDILEMHSHIARVVVCCGEDPFEFCATRLFVPVNRVLYFE